MIKFKRATEHSPNQLYVQCGSFGFAIGLADNAAERCFECGRTHWFNSVRFITAAGKPYQSIAIFRLRIGIMYPMKDGSSEAAE